MGQGCNRACNATATEGHVQEIVHAEEQEPEPLPLEVPEKVETAAPSTLTLEIVGARGLRDADWWPGYGKSDCYCVVKCQGKAVHTTKVVPDCLEPQWCETVEGMEWEEGQSLEFHIFDKDVCTSNFLGKVILESQSFATEGFNNEVQVAEAGEGISAFLRLKIKVPGKDFPAGRPASFEIDIIKGDASSWGLELDAQDPKVISVTRVKTGPVQLYNQGAPPERRLVENDFVRSVDGIEGNAQAMLAQFRMQKKVRLVVARSMEVTVCLDLTDPSADIGFRHPTKPLGNGLVILRILDSGAVPDYNRSMLDQALRIAESDRIMAVRGVKGGAAYVQSELTKTRGKVQITLLRPVAEK